MRCLLIIFCFFIINNTCAQTGYLNVKKNGRKVKTFYEGDYVRVQIGQRIFEGYLNLLKDDTVYIDRTAYHQSQLKTIYLPRKKPKGVSAKQIAFVTAGVALSTFGMVVSKYETFNDAIVSTSAIGYGPLAIHELKRHISFKRKKYKLGKKFTVQVLDFYPPVKRR